MRNVDENYVPENESAQKQKKNSVFYAGVFLMIISIFGGILIASQDGMLLYGIISMFTGILISALILAISSVVNRLDVIINLMQTKSSDVVDKGKSN